MNVVVDCSAVFELIFSGDRSEQYRTVLESAERVMAPELYKADCTNAMWKYVRSGRMTEEEAQQQLRDALALIDIYMDGREYAAEALHEAVRLGHSAYDMLYLTAARHTASVLLTVDERLRELAGQEGVLVY